MAKYEDEDFLQSEFDAAQDYIREHPEFALCRVKHDINLLKPPVDMAYHPDGGWSFIYICKGCTSEYRRRFRADGRYHSSSFQYAEGYVAESGSGFALVSKSGRAAFNTYHHDLMVGMMREKRRRN